MPPFFSIITATYNRASLLPATIGSMLDQTFSDFEIILVDDGSTDDTVPVLKSLYGNEEKLKIIRQQNKERGAARNTGIKNASGEYLVFADSDDTMKPHHLERLYANIMLMEKPNFISARYEYNDNGIHRKSPISALKTGWYDYQILLQGNVLGMYFAAKRDNPGLVLFEEDRKYAILEDWMFNFANLRYDKIYLTDDCTYLLNRHPGRSMESDHGLIIQRKELAKNWIIDHLDISQAEKNILESDFYFFAAIHRYLADDKQGAFTFLRKGIGTEGLRIKHLKLLIKVLVGRKLIAKLDIKHSSQ